MKKPTLWKRVHTTVSKRYAMHWIRRCAPHETCKMQTAGTFFASAGSAICIFSVRADWVIAPAWRHAFIWCFLNEWLGAVNNSHFIYPALSPGQVDGYHALPIS